MTVGEYLQKLREEKRISLDDAAKDTNIRVNYLQAIERDELASLPSQAQARGFTRLYAAYLGIGGDVSEIVNRINNPQVEEQLELKPEPVAEEPPAFVAVEKTTGGKKSRKPAEASAGKKEKPATDVEREQPKDVQISQAIFYQIGQDLRKQREALGLSLGDVERLTKIREFFIYSLENGRIDDLPSTVQGRGMLNNYAAFLSLNADTLQTRYAEGLQQKRQEQFQEEQKAKKGGVKVMGSAPLSGWRRFLTPDLLVGSLVFITLFSLVVWGATQMIRTSRLEAQPTISSISEVLVGDVTSTGVITPESTTVVNPQQTQMAEGLTTPVVDLQATLSASNFGPIQLVIVAYQRAFMSIIVDGKEEFSGRVIPGNVYSYSGSNKISLLTGNAAALQVYYNQQDIGILGPFGQVARMEFTVQEMITPTPQFSPTPTQTPRPTLTALPTRTPQPTATIPTQTITPARTVAP